MRKYLLVLLSITSLLFPPVIAAQDATPLPTETPVETASPAPTPTAVENAKAVYRAAVESYKKADSAYQLEKSRYAQSKTLTAQSKLRDANYQFLVARDEYIRTYLVFLREKINAENDIDATEKGTMITKINEQADWYQAHKDKIPSAGTLDDLYADSEKDRVQYQKTTIPTIYSAVALLPVVKAEYLYAFAVSLSDGTTAKIAEIRQNRDLDTTAVERWILETKNKLDRAQEKRDVVRQILLNPSNTDTEGELNTMIERLKEGIQYMKEANDYIAEIVRKVKTVG